MSKQSRPITVTLFRHGETKYTGQEKDLTRQGVFQIIENAAKFGRTLLDGEKVTIMTSPQKRTVYSAELIARVLSESGISLSEKTIFIEPLLDEVANFSWPLLSSLVNGGKIDIDGNVYDINKNLTNPKGLSVGKYYNDDGASEIPIDNLCLLPKQYLDRIQSVEKFSSVSRRLLQVLSNISVMNTQVSGDASTSGSHIVLVTHDALAGFPAEVFTDGALTGISQGESIEIRLTEKAVVMRVGALTSGNSAIDLFEEVTRR